MKKIISLIAAVLICGAGSTFASDREAPSYANPDAKRHANAWYQPTIEAIKEANNNLTARIPLRKKTYTLSEEIDMDKFNRIISNSSYNFMLGMNMSTIGDRPKEIQSISLLLTTKTTLVPVDAGDVFARLAGITHYGVTADILGQPDENLKMTISLVRDATE